MGNLDEMPHINRDWGNDRIWCTYDNPENTHRTFYAHICIFMGKSKKKLSTFSKMRGVSMIPPKLNFTK